MTDVSSTGSEVVNPAGVARLDRQAAAQSESSGAALASYQDPGLMNPTTQDQHPSAQRLSGASGAYGGYTGQLNHAQAAQADSDVWVTVPVDRVITGGGSSKVAPVYSTSKGYRSRPGDSAGSIPPTPAAGRPY